MKIEDIHNSIVKTGVLEYGDREYRVFICESDIIIGTGDYEDEFEIREDRDIFCFYVWYESIVTKDEISAGGGYYLQLNDALKVVEGNLGFKKWINE